MNSCMPKKPWMSPSARTASVGTPACASRLRVRLALVAQRVVLGGDHDRAREAGEVGRADRGEPRIVEVGRRARVVLPEPAHAFGFEEVALGVVDHRRAVELDLGDRVHEQLQLRLREPAFARVERDDRGEVAARAVAADRDAMRVGADLVRVRERPLVRGEAVVGRGRELRFRREPVVDRHHDRAGVIREQPPELVVRVEVARDPSATVEPQQQRQARLARSAGTRARESRPPGPGIVRSYTSCTGCFGNSGFVVAAIIAARRSCGRCVGREREARVGQHLNHHLRGRVQRHRDLPLFVQCGGERTERPPAVRDGMFLLRRHLRKRAAVALDRNEHRVVAEAARRRAAARR